MRIEWSARAVSDLRLISEYIEKDRNLDAANRVARAIYKAVESLGTMPYRGRRGRIEETRELVVPALPYVVIYQVFEHRVAIANIVHGAQKRP
jgi:toxin ParE1/3/4